MLLTFLSDALVYPHNQGRNGQKRATKMSNINPAVFTTITELNEFRGGTGTVTLSRVPATDSARVRAIEEAGLAAVGRAAAEHSAKREASRPAGLPKWEQRTAVLAAHRAVVSAWAATAHCLSVTEQAAIFAPFLQKMKAELCAQIRSSARGGRMVPSATQRWAVSSHPYATSDFLPYGWLLTPDLDGVEVSESGVYPRYSWE